LAESHPFLKNYNMDYIEFAKAPPILYGYMTVNGKQKIGSFKAEWNHNSNSLCYQYYSPKGNKGQGGFTLMKAFNLFAANRLSTNPADGNPDNYL
jgi:hypothetical protein